MSNQIPHIDKEIELENSEKNKLEESNSGLSPLELLLQNSLKYSLPVKSDFLELEFKGFQKEIVDNPKNLEFKIGQHILVEHDSGLNIGRVVGLGPLSSNKAVNCTCEEYRIVRAANDYEINRMKENEAEAELVVKRCKEISDELNLEMKVTEAEWQFDRQKLTIFFTAPNRIDFRELVKELARQFKTRIELRQISAREETKRLGYDVGPCGKDLCCTAFIKKFEHVTLEHAKMQRLSNNISKLSGNCGRLKCCLRFEYDVYEQELQKYPPVNSLLKTEKGIGKLIKVDIFREFITLKHHGEGTYEKVTLEEMNKLIENGNLKGIGDNRIEQENDFEDKVADEELRQLEDKPDSDNSKTKSNKEKQGQYKNYNKQRNNGKSTHKDKAVH